MKAGTIVGYKCKLCGATGHFDEFPKSIFYTEFGKECDTYCKSENCDGWNEDLEENVEWGEEFDVKDLFE